MAEKKYGSTVVVDHGRVVGVFTTVDALRALQELLAGARKSQPVQTNQGAAHERT
jgi:CBS domain-containing protein